MKYYYVYGGISSQETRGPFEALLGAPDRDWGAESMVMSSDAVNIRWHEVGRWHSGEALVVQVTAPEFASPELMLVWDMPGDQCNPS